MEQMIETTAAAVASCGSEPRKELKMVSTILDCFAKLARDKERERLDGGIALLRHMSRNKTEETQSKEVNYALTRLVRGLGSSRVLTRKSFYTTLTAYLGTNPDTRVQDLLRIMDAELRPVNSNPKSENADIHMGRILLCGALIRSKMIGACDGKEQEIIFNVLLSAGQQRSYLSFVSVSFLVDFLHWSDPKSLKAGIWPLLRIQLGKPWKEQTLDSFYVLLIMRDKFPNLVSGKYLKEHLGHQDIINGEHMGELLKLLTDIPRIACRRHPLFELFCKKIVSTEHLVEFWSGIDERFVKPSRSIEYLGLEIFKHILTNIGDNKAALPSLITQNFFHHMIRRSTTSRKNNRQDELATTFNSLLGQLVRVMNDKDIRAKTQVGVLRKLILYPGDIMIEKITGTRVVQTLTANMSADGVKKLSKVYQEIASNSRPREKRGDVTESWTNAERTYAAQLLTRLLGHPAVSTEHKWRLDRLKFLFDLGLCESPNVGVELAPQFKESFYRALDHKLPKLSDLRTVLSQLIHHLNEEVFVNKTRTPRTPLAGTTIEAWTAMMNFITRLEADSINKHALLIFYTMDLNMGLQLFSDPQMAISAINEIHSCSERLSNESKRSNEEIPDEPEWVEVIVDLLLSLLSRNSHLLRSMVRCVFPHVCTVLTAPSIHQILSVLDPKNNKSPLVSKYDETLDDSFNDQDSDSNDGEISEARLDNVEAAAAAVMVKDKEEEEEEEEEESDDEEEEEEEEEEDDDDDDDDDDDNDNDNDNDNDKEKEEEEEEDDDDDDEEEEEEEESDSDKDMSADEEDETVTDRLRLAVRQALGDACVQTDDEDIDVDQIEDDEGKRLDESLAAAFRILRENRQTQTRKQEKSAQTITHFRVRVMDLVETYIDSGPSMALALDMLVPLFGLLEYCIKDPHQKPLENRVRTCLRKLSGVKRFKDTRGVDAQLLTDVSKLLMEKGERSTAVCQEMGDKLAECATFIVRCVQQAALPADTLVRIYSDNLTAFFNKRDCVLPASLFKSALQLLWLGNWQLAPLLVDYAFDDTIRSFRRGQALEFLTIFYRNNRLVKSEERDNNCSVRLGMEKKLCAKSVSLLRQLATSLPSLNVESTSKRNPRVGKEVRQKFVSLLMTLLHAVYPRHLPEAWDWGSIAEAIADYRTRVSLSRDAKTAYNRLASQIGAPTNIATTRKNEPTKFTNGKQLKRENGSAGGFSSSENEENSTSEISRRESRRKLKNRGKQRDRQKLKREARELRAKAMSEGLESLDFGTVQFENGNAEDFVPVENGTSDKDLGKTRNARSRRRKRSIVHTDDMPSKTKTRKRNPEDT